MKQREHQNVNVFGRITEKYNIEYKQNPGKTG